jgi:hypothetical protein
MSPRVVRIFNPPKRAAVGGPMRCRLDNGDSRRLANERVSLLHSMRRFYDQLKSSARKWRSLP